MTQKERHQYGLTVGLCARNINEIRSETVESIIKQDFSHSKTELILVLSKNRSPTDRMLEILSRASISTRIYDDLGAGLGAARQKIVEEARGEFIVWVDSDVKLPQNFFREQFDFMRANKDVSVGIGLCDYDENEGNLIANIFGLRISLLRVVYFGATITRTQALRDVNGFDRRIQGAGEDVDIVNRLVIKKWRVTFNGNARFSRELTETLRSIFKRGMWYGRGGHFLNCKYESRSNIPLRLPPFLLLWDMKLSGKAYREKHTRKAFLLPLITLVQSIGWSIGYLEAHLAGYGHSISNSEINASKTKMAQRNINEMLSE